MIPNFLHEMLEKQYGKELTEKIENGYLCKLPTTLRVNNIKSNLQKIKNELQQNKIEFENIQWYEDAFIIKNANEDKIKQMSIFENGEIYLQSLSSMLPPLYLSPQPDENILDMCAAPGGKTTQLVSISQNKSHITACEKNKIRLEKLKYNLQKQGIGSVNVMEQDARNLSEYFSFDKILLDAPCSGSGTDNIFDEKFTEELISRSAKTQEILLEKALKILKPGGVMIYSTCSILEEENEQILNKVMKKFNCKIEPIQNFAGMELLPTQIDGTICVCPNEFFEGFFIAKIKKC